MPWSSEKAVRAAFSQELAVKEAIEAESDRSKSKYLIFQWPIPLILTMRWEDVPYIYHVAIVIPDLELGGLGMTEKSVGSSPGADLVFGTSFSSPGSCHGAVSVSGIAAVAF